MSRCGKCGEDQGFKGDRICSKCVQAWREKRVAAFKQAEMEFGPLCAENHARIVKRVKQLEA